ncbi:ECF RNA polymerase sigma factor SigL [Rubripirellula lacrimiformis]|uniref:ECF RNA polymerase sigma factor SigL n=1 Tax=Rubripirellula lacrimiformis TaxID=1930273 RepID=A0A517N8Z0_9BACT|nr:sigma-70 family RNA polymerase sigma factor [Rubripirellula lacrimiformis]QDT03610.1 ECF RNA polymerase sigma factor SigL [Rubripirellula lacrimiformis]
MTTPPSPWPPGRIDEIVDRYQRPLLAYAARMNGGDWQGSQDAVQETFLRLCRERPEKIDARIAAWLFSVCRSRVIDMQRTARAMPIDVSQSPMPDPAPDAQTAAIDAEEHVHLDTLMDGLSPRQQEVLRLRMTGRLSYREIADVTGLSVSNVGFHLHEAVRSLRTALAH